MLAAVLSDGRLAWGSGLRQETIHSAPDRRRIIFADASPGVHGQHAIQACHFMSVSSPVATAPAQGRVLARVLPAFLLAVGTVLAFLLTFRFDNPAAGYDLDPSWAAVVSWAFEHDRQWGTDIAFTYGPLGLLSPYFSYRSSIIGLAAAAQVGFAALYALVFLQAGRGAPIAARVVAVVVLLAFGAGWAGDVAWLTLYPLALLALWRLREREGWSAGALAAVIGATCAVPWLAKFSLFPLWLLWLACAAVLAGRRAGAIAVAASLAASLLLWFGSGQQAQSLWPYLSSSWRIAVGYGSAMQWRGLPAADAIDVVGLVVLLSALSAQILLLARAPLGRGQRWAALALTAGCTVLAFKAAYTRADTFHLPLFFPACAMAVLVASALRGPGQAARIGSWAALACALIAFAPPYPGGHVRMWLVSGPPGAVTAVQRLHSLVGYSSRVDELEHSARAARAAIDLPHTRRIVGDAPIDIVSVGQGLLLSHGMNYRPRPVFQGYSTYTPELARMNASFLASARAPDWVLMDMAAIDGRYPTSEDPQALLRLLRDYRAAAIERGLVLMRRGPTPSAEASVAAEVSPRIGEFVAVPAISGDGVEVRFSLQPTLWSRLASATLRAPRLFLDVESTDGQTRTYRLVPGAAEAGFLLSPAIEDTRQLWDWLERRPVERIVRFRVRSEDWLGQPSLQPVFRVQYRSVRLAGP
ncbi:hypothetical protein [Lysobacter sp. CA199]|uniref:hypothetical protein n=1 Tax=Lysobacter sp. CA199 TaxID=3455608 RepID=UPI003F8D0DAD